MSFASAPFILSAFGLLKECRLPKTVTATDKFCKDCRWCRPQKNVGARFSLCVAPQLGLSPVTGESPEAFCSVQRNTFSGTCTTAGNWWEAK